MMKPEKIKFHSYDGYKLEGTFLPADGKPKAALLFVHGICSDRDELGFHSDMAVFLSRNNITSLRFDYRYHGIFETSLEQLTLSGIVNDIDAAFGALKHKVSGLTKKFFLVATSFGGGLSAYWVNRNTTDDIRKLFLNAPVIDYEDDVLGKENLLSGNSLVEKAAKSLRQKGFVKSSDIKFGQALINELRYLNGIDALKSLGEKVMIFHGKDDEDVPLSSSQKFKTSKTGLSVIPNVGHGFGIDIDEDLTHPETKAIHQQIYDKVLKIIQQETK